MNLYTFQPGASILWVPDRRVFNPGIVQWTTGATSTVRLADGRQRTVPTRHLICAVCCPNCKAPGIVTDEGYQVCPICNGPATSLPSPELVNEWPCSGWQRFWSEWIWKAQKETMR